METYLTIVHPIHGIIGDILTVLLCIPVAGLFLFAFLWPLYVAIRDWIGVADQVPIIPEDSLLQSLPLGAPRDGGNYVYDGKGWSRLTEEEAMEVRNNLKLNARRDPEGWDILAPETAPAHSEHLLEILNDSDGDFDGPDDAEDEEEVERPDELVIGLG